MPLELRVAVVLDIVSHGAFTKRRQTRSCRQGSSKRLFGAKDDQAACGRRRACSHLRLKALLGDREGGGPYTDLARPGQLTENGLGFRSSRSNSSPFTDLFGSRFG